MTQLRLSVSGEEAMVALGQRLGSCCQQGVIYLRGNLGMGKTTLTRGILQAFGHRGAVKSPTYTLVEPYENLRKRVYHFDLYRLGDPEELEYMGIRDYFAEDNLCLIEWPDQGLGFLPRADLEVTITLAGEGRSLTLQSNSPVGDAIVQDMSPRMDNNTLSATK